MNILAGHLTQSTALVVPIPNTSYWPLIQHVFYFKPGYQMAHYRREKGAGFDEYWEADEVIMQRIKALFQQDEINDLQNPWMAVDKCFQAIADYALVHFGPPPRQRKVPKWSHSTPAQAPKNTIANCPPFCSIR
jgi:hypothetical protein